MRASLHRFRTGRFSDMNYDTPTHTPCLVKANNFNMLHASTKRRDAEDTLIEGHSPATLLGS